MKIFLLFVTALLVSGCATVVNGRLQPMALRSVPDAATITMTNRSGEQINAGQTPVVLNLMRGWGYFKPERYHVVVSKPGYRPVEFNLDGRVSGWYFGNLVIPGGVLGILFIDATTGAMFTLAPEVVGKSLDQLGLQANEDDGSLTIMLAENVPDELRKQAIPVN